MNKETRNILRNVVTEMRRKLEDAVSKRLEGHFGIHDTGKIDGDFRMGHLDDEGRANREQLLGHLEHVKSGGFNDADAVDQLKREIAFTHLNRLVAFKLMEKRGLIRQAVSEGVKSRGLEHYLAEHDDDAKLYDTGDTETAYRNFLSWQAQQFEDEIGVLFAYNDPANAVYPPQLVLDEVLALINSEKLASIWTEDETIGWVYQYFTPKELRDKAREESQAPRNSYELAFRNQFYTPRYVVEFLTDNTLGRTWYEMHQGDTALKDHCRYLVRQPNEIFMRDGEEEPEMEDTSHLPQEELLQQPVYIPYRAHKDPRRLKILDPACGSGHFLLYCFDLLTIIYEESWHRDRTDPIGNWNLRRDYTSLDALRRDLPRLILRHNLHGIDIDRRATQIAALALWLRAQRYYNDHNIKRIDRPKISQGNIVLAEAMPGNKALLKEFTTTLNPPILGQLVERVFDEMQLAGEAGSLLKIEEAIQDDIKKAKKLWETGPKPEQLTLFPDMATKEGFKQLSLFDVSAIDDVQFWTQAEKLVLQALESYAQQATNGKGLQRRLFAQDATGGFVFIEILRGRYDVVLMNPPFGEVAKTSRDYLYEKIPSAAQDIFAAFVDRYLALLLPNATLGAITNRLGFFKNWLENWRKKFYGTPLLLSHLADLGYGVLDDAVVEAAAYIIQNRSIAHKNGIFINELEQRNKETSLAGDITVFNSGFQCERIHLIDVSLFKGFPHQTVPHWCEPSWLALFVETESAFDHVYEVKLGLASGDDFRFLRLTWEIANQELRPMNKWTWVVKGGEYEPYYSHIHMCFNWESLKKARRTTDAAFFGISGATYTQRTTSNFSARVLPPKCMMSYGGPGIFPRENVSIFGMVALLNSSAYLFLIEMVIGGGDTSQAGTAARNIMPSLLESLPATATTVELTNRLERFGQELYQISIQDRSHEETREFFNVPFQLSNLNSIGELAEALFQDHEDRVLKATALSEQVDQIVSITLQLGQKEISEVQNIVGRPFPSSDLATDRAQQQRIINHIFSGNIAMDTNLQVSRAAMKRSAVIDDLLETICHVENIGIQKVVDTRRAANQVPPWYKLNVVEHTLSYTLGSVLGRWNVRKLVAAENFYLPTGLIELPTCPPGMLQNADGLPATETPEDYPLDIVWEGILVDDENHPNDIVRRTRDVLNLLWGDNAGNIEAEMLGILDEKSLRAYFRRSGNGGFWMNHVSRYSKSRRKAPIYWYLRSRNGNYGVWLYYHRLDGDLLFKALTNYVRPKVQELQHRVTALSSQKSDKNAQAAFEDAESLLNELLDFQAKLQRAAELGLTPDLNDGVVLNIAPLHELVPWGEAASYWNELLAGKYEWSSIGKQLKVKGLVK